MTSRPQPKRTRKPPEERRAEILETAARIALQEGLELITLRRVADELGVRPGLIGHYFPVADNLVSEAFTYATTAERESLLPPQEEELPPLDRLARFLVRLADGDYLDLSRLWLNARHLSRFKAALRQAVSTQESATRAALVTLIDKGVQAGEFTTDDPLKAALHVLVTVDGLGAYANDDTALDGPDLGDMAIETAETRLGLAAGTLRARAGGSGPTASNTSRPTPTEEPEPQ
ncbi:TetR family transcriptional regulator [Streptomyces sp. ISL-36]|uniref:TetR/AcrR family transcriptional regulator n=1 Tax=Streptomyces sp. ISL-36 TaxID=2819182 RepID=UPI001BE6087F|nr:TetR family transcriptional regulator [Streptomyces sp. ISL-36]MBT2441790.1 TetR family transcriptional regulator [Streptomyces sp. ISL-36]